MPLFKRGTPKLKRIKHMRHKNDIAMAASSARSYNRHWRAKKLSWNAIGKIKYLFDGAVEYMDEVTLAYTSEHFNKLRTVLGFKQDSELTELIEQSEAFRIVRDKDTRQIVAFMSPLVRDRFVPTSNQEIEEPAIPYDIFFCKANALANDNDRDKISENQRQHRNGIDMHVLLAGNVPKFHITPNEEAVRRIEDGLWKIFNDEGLRKLYYGSFCIITLINTRQVLKSLSMCYISTSNSTSSSTCPVVWALKTGPKRPSSPGSTTSSPPNSSHSSSPRPTTYS